MTVRGQRTGSRYYACLEMVNRHLAKLTREYTATPKGDLRALAIAEELSQVGDETHELATTTKYMRTVEERIRHAVESWGRFWGRFNGRKWP